MVGRGSFSRCPLIVGNLINSDSKVFFVGDKKTNFKNVIKKLRRIGFDNIVGILNENINDIKGLSKFEDEIDNNASQKIINLDLSKKIGDINIEISQIINYNFDIKYKYKVVCKNGYKAMAVKSYLKRRGYVTI